MNNSSGATSIEYALIVTLIAVVLISSLKLLGTNLSLRFNAIAKNLN
jgi:pilus assembly protein Flp/PilA